MEEIKKEEIKLIFGLTPERAVEAKKIWDQHKGQYAAKYIFLNYMKDFFVVPDTNHFSHLDKNFIYFINHVKRWKNEDRKMMAKISAENLTDDEIVKMQESNRKEVIFLLREILDKYKKDPETFRKITINDISKIYQIVQSAEQASQRIELQKGKLKLEAAKTFLPYQRLSINQLTELRDLIDSSIQKLLEEKRDDLQEAGERATLPRVE